MKSISLAFVAASILVAANAGADDSSVFSGRAPQTDVVIGQSPDTYGTGSLTAYVVGSYQFQTAFPVPDQQLMSGGGIDRFVFSTGGFQSASATPMLPNGSQVERIELRACDTDAAAQVFLVVGSCGTAAGSCISTGQVGTGVAATPGCNVFSTTLAAPLVVDNQGPVLFVNIATGTTSATTFSAAKLYYRLRISPAPATATFPNDVPTTHPFFRFVEALAAAGVTGGCGAGSYCPDTPVTRGQMAVFLATALGLHFPN